ncbi:MAG: hypothetical protein LWY06_15645 [Firmicutes bacterium]|nr:hypothetical protein [Bacillota bacterium]
MVLPKGNPLIEKTVLPFADVNIHINNLEQQSFTGFVKLELYKVDGIIFFTHGNIVRSVEMDETNSKVQPLARLLNRIKRKDVSLSTYVLSPRIVGVMSLLFSFQPLYLDYEVKAKELKKVMSTLEADSYTGIIEVVSRDGTAYLLIDKGELVIDSFAREYGQIICGADAVSKYLNFVSKEGATINIFAEKHEEIESKRKLIEEELEKIKQLIVKEEKGFFKQGDIFWLDEYIVQEWGVRNIKNLQLELETPDGVVHVVKGATAKKLGGYISATSASLKKIKLKEGDLVSIKPTR